MKKRSLIISGHKTSVSLEDPFWEALQDMARAEGVSLAALIQRLDAERSQSLTSTNLSSYLRMAVLHWHRKDFQPKQL